MITVLLAANYQTAIDETRKAIKFELILIPVDNHTTKSLPIFYIKLHSSHKIITYFNI